MTPCTRSPSVPFPPTEQSRGQDLPPGMLSVMDTYVVRPRSQLSGLAVSALWGPCLPSAQISPLE